jgi:Flp pilus assembly CpaF family ATPase
MFSQVEISFASEHLMQIIRQIAQLVGVLINEQNPHLATRFSNGMELAIVMPPISRQGPILTIHKGIHKSPTIDDLINANFLTDATADFLRTTCLSYQSVLIVGNAGSGKRALLQGLLKELPLSERLVYFEKYSELRLEHPHILSFALPAAMSNISDPEVATENLLHTVGLLRPHRLLIESLEGSEVASLLQLLTGGYSGSLAVIRASHLQHALQLLEMNCLRVVKAPSIVSLRSQIVSAFQLAVICKRTTDGNNQLFEISELLPLDNLGDYRLLPIFRRRLHSNNTELEHKPDELAIESLLPTGNIPSFWHLLKIPYGKNFDRAFFHPANYDAQGIRIPSKISQTHAQPGVPVTIYQESENSARFQHPINPRAASNVFMPGGPGIFSPSPSPPPNSSPNLASQTSKSPNSESMSASAKIQPSARRVSVANTRNNNSDENEEEPYHSAPLPQKEIIELIEDLDTIRKDRPPPRQIAIPSFNESEENLNSYLHTEKEQMLLDHLLGEDLSRAAPHAWQPIANNDAARPQPKENLPRATSQSHSWEQVPTSTGLAIDPSVRAAAARQTESSGISDALTVSRNSPNHKHQNSNPWIQNSPQVIVDPILLAASKPAIEGEVSQILDVSDIIADDLPSMVSEDELRGVERELRRQIPVQKREISTEMNSKLTVPTEVVNRTGVISERAEQNYNNADSTFVGGNAPANVSPLGTAPETPSVDEMMEMSYGSTAPSQKDLTALPSRPSVVVRRGQRHTGINIPSVERKVDDSSRMPNRKPTPPTPPTHGILPTPIYPKFEQNQSHALHRESFPFAEPSPEHQTSEVADDETLIRGRRPPPHYNPKK